MAAPRSTSTEPRIISGAGPRATEQALLSEIDRLLPASSESSLSRAIWIVVPSNSLRSHILAKIVRHRGNSVVGLGCWTLHGLATEILRQSESTVLEGKDLLPILVRRIAPQEEALHDGLDHLADGYAAVLSSVEDLLDAGLEIAHHEALEDILAEEGPSVAERPAVARALGLIRVATAAIAELETIGHVHPSGLLRAAAEQVRFHPGLHQEPRALLVHGFADATGAATDLIEALVDRFQAKVFLDLAPEIGELASDPAGIEFGRVFRERLALATSSSTIPGDEVSEPPRIRLIEAYGTQAEAREVATRIRGLIDSGEEPESIAVVARQPAGYIGPLRTHFTRIGIPFSGVGLQGHLLPSGRALQRLADLLATRGRCSIDHWLDLRIENEGETRVFDLRLALFSLGARAVDEVVELDLSSHSESYAIPARTGFVTDDDPESAGLRRRRVAITDLEKLQREATEICRLFEAWSGRRSWEEHHQRLLQLEELLGWSSELESSTQMSRIWSRLAVQLDAGLTVSLDEIVVYTREVLRSVGYSEFGGRGGGVQVMDVTAARGRTFRFLFLVGMNQGVFPRNVREDPLLDDRLRRVISREGHSVLPDLARKRVGHSEERFLFAQLLWSSPQVTLSWCYADDDGKPLTVSPLVERLRLNDRMGNLGPLAIERARHPFSIVDRTPAADDASEVLTPHEIAVRTGLSGDRTALGEAIAEALEARSSTIDRPPIVGSTSRLSAARLSLLDEFDPDPWSAAAPGPFFGYLGPSTDAHAPRVAQRLYITTLEAMARCPWQTFLQKVLRLERYPDPTDELPTFDALAIGSLVHRILEQLVERGLDAQDDAGPDAEEDSARPFSWPNPDLVKRITHEQSYRFVRETGLTWFGLENVLAKLVEGFISSAIALGDFASGSRSPVAVEREGQIEIAGYQFWFRSDRVDRTETGVTGVDYKTSKRSIYRTKSAGTKRRDLLDAIASGRQLQAAAYAFASGGTGDGGEYQFIRPDLKAGDSRCVDVLASDAAVLELFSTAVETLAQGWLDGFFFPRIVEATTDREPSACSYCDVAEACLRGDSGARQRLRSWALQGADPSSLFSRLWNLGETDGED